MRNSDFVSRTVVAFFGAAAVATIGLLASPAFAGETISAGLTTDTAIPPGYSLADLNSYDPDGMNAVYTPSSSFTVNGAMIAFGPGAYLAKGALLDVVAAPVIGPGNTDVSTYLAAEPNADVTLTFASKQTFFGMLWGSVDAYNTLYFYNGTTIVDEITGTDLANIAGILADGSQVYGGSAWVGITFGDGDAFTKVVARSSTPAFEFDFVSVPAAVPEPGTLAILGAAFAGLAGLAACRRRVGA